MPRMTWNSEDYTVKYRCPQCECMHVINVGIFDPKLPVWKFNGNFELPTLNPSINITGQCHHYVEVGKIKYVSESCNRLSGQELDLPEI